MSLIDLFIAALVLKMVIIVGTRLVKVCKQSPYALHAPLKGIFLLVKQDIYLYILLMGTLWLSKNGIIQNI